MFLSPRRLGCSVAETQLFIGQRWVSTSFQPSLPRFIREVNDADSAFS
jgi:hypothetical protein